MPTNHYHIDDGSTQTALGRELLDTLEQAGDAFARLTRLFDAWTQAKDGSAGDATDHVTPAALFRVLDGVGGAVSSAVAEDAYAELNSFIGNAGPSLEQACARFKQ